MLKCEIVFFWHAFCLLPFLRLRNVAKRNRGRSIRLRALESIDPIARGLGGRAERNRSTIGFLETLEGAFKGRCGEFYLQEADCVGRSFYRKI